MRYIMLYPYVALVEGKDTGALYDLLNRKVIELEPEEFNILKQAKRGTSIDELYGYNLSDIHQVLNKIKQFKLGFDYESNKPYFCDLLKTSDEAMKLSHFKKPPRLSRLYIELNNQCKCKCWFCGDNPLKRTLGCLGCNIWNRKIEKKLDTFTITELFTTAIEMNFQEIVLTGGNIFEEWSIIQSISDFFSKIKIYIIINLCSLDPFLNIQQFLSITDLNYILNVPLLTEEDSGFESCVISSVKGPDNLTGHRSSGKLDSNQTINYRREKR
ncbi:MAG: hypothetical protein ACOX2E_02730 [Syntrophaceticus sp.]|jgi:hypothetical protein